MSEIRRYVLVNEDDHEEDFEYWSYAEAERAAKRVGSAIIARTYEFADSELAWTPDGGDVWPPGSGDVEDAVNRKIDETIEALDTDCRPAPRPAPEGPPSLYDELENRGWFCYHSDGDGDHYRKHGLSGVRATLFGSEGSIWRKATSGVCRGDWIMRHDFAEDGAAFLTAIDALEKSEA
jgi:hypothetical protein